MFKASLKKTLQGIQSTWFTMPGFSKGGLKSQKKREPIQVPFIFLQGG